MLAKHIRFLDENFSVFWHYLPFGNEQIIFILWNGLAYSKGEYIYSKKFYRIGSSGAVFKTLYFHRNLQMGPRSNSVEWHMAGKAGQWQTL